MKQLLLTFLLLPFYCSAQLEAGINGGFLADFARLNASSHNSMFGANLCYKINSIKIGLSYDRDVESYNVSGINGINKTQYFADPLSYLFCYVDRELHYNKIYGYFGAGLGLAIKNNSYEANGSAADATFDAISVCGHVGIGYDIYKGLCINAQAGIIVTRTSPLTAYYFENYPSGRFTTYPVTLGIHYKFHSHKKKRSNGLNINRFVK